MKFYIAVVSFVDRSAGTVSSFSQKCQYAVPAHFKPCFQQTDRWTEMVLFRLCNMNLFSRQTDRQTDIHTVIERERDNRQTFNLDLDIK